jgi:thiol-disulfide isomerase/thioredoxin
MKPIRILFLSLLLSPALAWALEIVPYQADDFARARAAGKVTAIQFHSGWCPICVMQDRGVRELSADKAFAQVVVFRADFAKEDELRKRFGVNSFSTLVIFRGEEERARTTGDFQAEKLKQLFAKAL